MTVPMDDRGLLLGDGLFETILAIDGALILMEAHVARMIEGCAVLGLPPPAPDALRAAAREALRAAGLEAGRAAVRLTLTAGSGGRGLERPGSVVPRLFATAAPSPRPSGPVSLALATVRRNETSPAARLKTLAYLDNILARREAQAAGADDAVMLNTRGEVACATVANLLWITAGRLYTPALHCGVLAGVVRGEILRRAAETGMPVVEIAAGPEALAGADAVMLTSSLVGVRPVMRLEDRTFEANAATQSLLTLAQGIS